MPDGLSQNAQTLLNRIPEYPERKGNITLRRELRWGRNRYEEARRELVLRELVVLGKGQGGSVSRRMPRQQGQRFPAVAREADLYAPLLELLKEEWGGSLEAEEGDALIAEITANQGNTPTGLWTRPDITLLKLVHHRYIPIRAELEVTTFEVKKDPSERDLKTGLYEAASHRKAVHYAYLLVHSGEPLGKHQRILAEAKRLGVGVRRSYSTGSTIELADSSEGIEAVANQPVASDLNGFLGTQLSEENLKELRNLIDTLHAPRARGGRS